MTSSKVSAMSIEGIDEHGRRVRVYDVGKHLKEEAKKVSSKPVVKKPACSNIS